ncbi:MAG: hypothetical protein KJ041_06055 [Gammaproteobacteria bacterium]|nr:hypothetical protein [Gammaproteobacteria bacterium]
MLAAITIGTLGGALLAFFVSKWLLGVIARKVTEHPQRQTTIKVSGALFAAIALAPAIFMSVMGGGKMGEHYAVLAAQSLGLGEGAVPLILSLEIIAATTLTVIINACVGATLGILIGRGLFPARRGQ